MRPSVSILSALVAVAPLAAAAGPAVADEHGGNVPETVVGLVEPEQQEILADIRDNNMSAEEIRGEPLVGAVTVVDLSGFRGEGDLQALQRILDNAEDEFAEIRTAIAVNEHFEAAIEDKDVPVSKVIAVTRQEDAAITVYYRSSLEP
ncbi:hypothetical protein N1F89_04315 [Aquibium sp. A9E412]|uniref:hypothetical protein n=1 Tax=Aquibium sp. A9E412 TaxID=2976767 RepID=UPI0025B05C9B|nr:hypothetical protein [Aquibium sp. A9E412]MDN2565436.1 hypothetical protein [Aquibium sp. A9E412]